MVLITILVKLGEHSIPSHTLGMGRSKRGDVLPNCLHDIDKITLTGLAYKLNVSVGCWSFLQKDKVKKTIGGEKTEFHC